MKIESRQDYKYFLEADRIALAEFNRKKPNKISRCENDVLWKYQILLRKIEYNINCKNNNIFDKLYLRFLQYKFFRMQMKTMMHIQPNCFGPGLSIAHVGPLIVSGKATIGMNCRLHPYTTIGVSGRELKVAQIGDDAYLSNGCKIIGNVKLGNNVVVGAGAVLVKSYDEDNVVLAGVPAKPVSYAGSPFPDERKGAYIAKYK